MEAQGGSSEWLSDIPVLETYIETCHCVSDRDTEQQQLAQPYTLYTLSSSLCCYSSAGKTYFMSYVPQLILLKCLTRAFQDHGAHIHLCHDLKVSMNGPKLQLEMANIRLLP
jgi:hypothetical protein